MNAEEELQDLRQKFSLLEGDRKAYYETSQLTIKQNRDSVGVLKKENKELRQALSDSQREAGAQGGKGSTSKSLHQIEMEKLEERIMKMRREYDQVCYERQQTQRSLESTRERSGHVEKETINPMDSDNAVSRQIRMLENRLDKAMIKFNEAQSIRKTYEQITKRLKEERIGFDNQLAAIERTLKAKERDYEELLLMSHDALHARDVARSELSQFRHVHEDNKHQREKELSEKKAYVDARVENTKRLEQREQARQQAEQEEAQKREAEKAKTNSAAASGDPNSTPESAEAKALAEEERVNRYEEMFRKIKEVTGVSDTNEVINKFVTQEETQHSLEDTIKESQSKIDALNDEKTALKAKVEELKYSNSQALGSRRIVDEFESHLAEANAACERNRQKYERVAKILINVKAGIEHLYDKLRIIQLESQANGAGSADIAVTDETVVDVTGLCEQKLVKCVSELTEAGAYEPASSPSSGAAAAPAQPASSGTANNVSDTEAAPAPAEQDGAAQPAIDSQDHHQQQQEQQPASQVSSSPPAQAQGAPNATSGGDLSTVELPANNVRIKLPSTTEEGVDGSSSAAGGAVGMDSDDEDGDVLNRETVKKLAAIAVEKATRKPKKKRAGNSSSPKK